MAKRISKRLRNEKGFTLVELMIVVIIIGILTAVGVPLYMGYVDDARKAEAQAAIGSIVTAQKLYYQKNATFATEAAAQLNNPDSGLKIDLRDASANWTFAIPAATDTTFSVTATGVGDAYVGLEVRLDYNIAGAETWTGID